jgi:hypothetical protein
MRYTGKRALVTGGLGFIGSNLSIRLVEEGADVTVVDSSVGGCGANRFNLDPAKDRMRVISADIGEGRPPCGALEIVRRGLQPGRRDQPHPQHAVPGEGPADQHRRATPLPTGVRRRAPGVRVVYASTRQIYGVPDYLPVDEKHPIQPVDFNGVHKYAASMYHRCSLGRGRSTLCSAADECLWSSNGSEHPCQGFLSTFLRRLILVSHSRCMETGGNCAIPSMWRTPWKHSCAPVWRAPLRARL